MMERRRTRSDQYQALFAEISCADDVLNAFCNEDSIHGRLTGGFVYDETLLELEDQLKKEFWRIVDSLLTERQKQVIHLYADGYTQMEIAKVLNVNQSSITKSLNGNVDYSEKKISNKSNGNKSGSNKKQVYGGSKRRLKKLIENDPKIKEILDKMAEIRENKW